MTHRATGRPSRKGQALPVDSGPAPDARPWAAFHPLAKNPNQHTAQGTGMLASAMSRHGYVAPMTAARNGAILDGNLRLETSATAFADVAPIVVEHDGTRPVVMVRTDIPDEQDPRARDIIVSANRIAEVDLAYDLDVLREFAADGLDLRPYEFDADLLEQLVDVAPGRTDPDDVPDERPTAIVPGDLFELGAHRLICGDSTTPADVASVLAGERAPLCWTDPPWNVAYGSQADHPSWKARTITNDNLGDRFPAFCQQFCAGIAAVLVPGGHLYLAMSAQEWPTIHRALGDAGFHWSSSLIWAKDTLVLSRKDYHTQYEPIWYGWLDGAARLHPLADRTQSDLWTIPRPKRSDEHPTMKPVELVERAKAATRSSRTNRPT